MDVENPVLTTEMLIGAEEIEIDHCSDEHYCEEEFNPTASDDITEGIDSETDLSQIVTPDYVVMFKKATEQMLQSLVLPSFGAYNSLLSDVNVAPTNVFACPLIPEPASDFSALYTSLKRAEGVSTWFLHGLAVIHR